MQIQENVPLKDYSTMRLGGAAAYLTNVVTQSEIPQALAWAQQRQLPVIMIGDGSNIVWGDNGFPGLVLVNKLISISQQQPSADSYSVTAAAGVNWDEFVAHVTKQGLTGVEFLSLIPGTVGATPVQNVGAYGQEVANTLESVEAYDRYSRVFVTLKNDDCEFGYRTSRFKAGDRGRFFITAVTFSLSQGNPQPPYYGSLQEYFDAHDMQHITPANGREAVIAIRRAKLPDPKVVANNGSFFANPVIDTEKLADLQRTYPDIMHWTSRDNQIKLPAAWLIEQVGFKDFHDPATGMATWPSQPLVIVNEHAKSANDLLAFKQKIVDAVQQKFGVTLEQEPEFIA